MVCVSPSGVQLCSGIGLWCVCHLVVYSSALGYGEWCLCHLVVYSSALGYGEWWLCHLVVYSSALGYGIWTVDLTFGIVAYYNVLRFSTPAQNL